MRSWRVSQQPLYADDLSPLIYGDFIELINDMIPGMWSEMVQDRCFEGCLQPKMLWRPEEDWTRPRWETFVTGRPQWEHWPVAYGDLEAPHPRVSFGLDQYTYYAGRQSARVRVEAVDRPCIAGIAQHGIAVQQGQALRFEMAIRGPLPPDAAVQVLLGRNYGVFFKSYSRLEFRGIDGEWQKCAGTLISPVTDAEATLAIGMDGPGAFWLDKVSLMPEDSPGGWRPDVVQAIRDLKPGIIRFGGSSLIFYQWQNGIGPRDRRAPFENRPWGNLEENDVGLHEFLQFCERVGAEPMVCLNSNSTTIQQVMEEIEYCNGPADSPFGSIRAAMGHPEPFNVQYWQIGNEQSGAEYERVLVEYARAIRTAYPGLVLLASYPSERLLLELSDWVDYVCPHLYDPYTPQMEEQLRQLIAQIQSSARNKQLKLGITEWNHTASHWGSPRSWLLTLYNALNAARMLNMYQRLGDRVRIANRSNLVNSSCSGIVQTRPTDIYLTPCYHVQRAYANYTGNRALEIDLGGEGTLDVSATYRTGERETVLAVVNCQAEAQPRRIEFGAGSRTVSVWSLSGPTPDAVNSFEDKRCVAPVESTVTAQGSPLDYTFAPYSVTILRCREN